MPFRIALSGLNAASANLEVTANNIANVNTVGFKGSRPDFSAVYAFSAQQTSSASVGAGVRLTDVSQEFAQGNIDFTNNTLDLAIGGEGFFIVEAAGAQQYTRAGNFQLDNEGFVVTPSGERLQAFVPNAGGGFNIGQLSDVQISRGVNSPSATTQAGFGLNLPADAAQPAAAPFDPTEPTTYNHSTSVTVYDSLGASHTATMYFVKDAAANAWTAHTTIDGTVVGAGQAVTFDNNGNLATPAGGTYTLPAFTPGTGAADITVTVDLAEATQFGGAFTVNSISQDGSAPGTLAGIDIDPEGVLTARYTNGRSETLGKIAMANFDNAQGLQQLGDSWAQTNASGPAIVGEASTGRFGSITSGALEASNVDLTEELVNMITAQRNFQANAQMISTADQTTQTIINIR